MVAPTAPVAGAPALTPVGEAFEVAGPLVGSGDALLVCDFDGTLSPHVLDPWSARIVPGARRALRRLSRAPGVTVVFLSGRGVADLAGRARVGGATYLGDHGAERAAAARGFRPAAIRPARVAARPDEHRMADALATGVATAIGRPWLAVERKGAAVAFHFRGAPDVAAARGRVLAAVEAVDPDGLLVRHAGTRVVELRPASAPTKGDAMAALIAERTPRSVIALGDDRNDALGFDALREARGAGRIEGLAVAVAGHPDVIDDVWPRADLMLASPAHAARLLRALADHVGAR